MSLRDAYCEYIAETNRSGSNKADSYLHAIDYLGPILAANSRLFQQCGVIWSIDSAKRISDIYEYIIDQQKRGAAGIFVDKSRKSYWRNGFYSAALNSYRQFLVLHKYERKLLEVYDDKDIKCFTDDHFNKEIDDIELLANGNPGQQGEDVVRELKARVNQQVFRKKILAIYDNQCCITGLDIPEINRASHIISWADNKAYRLDPTNGLCLSATYDAAFDKHLISLDDDYRLILSPSLREHYTKDIVKNYFHQIEGRKIKLPRIHEPSQSHLKEHRRLM